MSHYKEKMMGTYWNEFIKRYETDIPHIPLVYILKAFYSFTEGNIKRATQIMGAYGGPELSEPKQTP